MDNIVECEMPDKTIEDYQKKFKNLLLNKKYISSQYFVKEQQEVIIDSLKVIGRTSASSITIQEIFAKEFGIYLDKKQAKEISRRFFKENVSASDKKKTGILSYKTKIQKFKESSLFNLKTLPLTAENTKVVLQREFRITSAKEAQPFVATFGFNTCSVVILYQQDSQKASLAHIDASAALYSLQPFIESFERESDLSRTRVTILGGLPSAITHLYQQFEEVNFKNITAVSWKENEFPSRKIAIDSRNGRLCSFMSSVYVMAPADRKRHDDFELYRLRVHSPLSFVDQVIADEGIQKSKKNKNKTIAGNSTAGALQIVNPETNKIESLITSPKQSSKDKENATGYIWAFVQPQQFVVPRISQSQMGRVIQFPIVQQQGTGIFAKAAGAETLRFSSSFNTPSQVFSQTHNASIVKLHPQAPFVTEVLSRMGSPYLNSVIDDELSGCVIDFPSKATRVPIAQSSFAKGVGYYMWARAGYNVVREIGKARAGEQSWGTTGKNLTYISVGITSGLVLSWALPTIALAAGCSIIANDVYGLLNPRKSQPKIRFYKASLPPVVSPGGLITLNGPLANKLKEPVLVETLNHITYSSITPIGKLQICPDPRKPLGERVSRLMKQSEYNKISNIYGQTLFSFSYDIKTLPFGGVSQIRLECKIAYHEFLSHRMSTSLDRKDPKPFVMEFSERQSYPGFIKVIYPKQSHLCKKTKPYVVWIDVARQQIIINYYHNKPMIANSYHTKPSEKIAAYIARTLVPKGWLKGKVDPAMIMTVDYRGSTTPKVTIDKSGMKFHQQTTSSFDCWPRQNGMGASAKTIVKPLSLKIPTPSTLSGK